MKGLELSGNGELRHLERPSVTPPEGYALIKVAAAGICGSDLGRAFKNGAYHYPLIMGHEFAGTVERPANGSTRFRSGDRVAVYPLLPCGRCPSCREGQPQLCDDYDYFGSRCDGGFAEYVAVPEDNLVPVPDGVSLAEAALTEPAAVAHHAVAALAPESGSDALVFGAGPVGNLAAQWLKLKGCSRVYVVDLDERKLELARQLGCHGINARETDVTAFIREATGGRGVANCVEACGLPVTCRQALENAAARGKVLLIGNLAADWLLTPREYSRILRRELRLIGSWNSRIDTDWSAVMRYCGRGLELRPLISHEAGLADGPDLFRRMLAAREYFCKAVFKIGE